MENIHSPSVYADRRIILARAAALGAHEIRSMFRLPIDKLKIYFKEGVHSPVSVIDYRSEDAILDRWNIFYPNDTVVAEERRSKKGNPNNVMTVDPLDGTNNVEAGLPFPVVGAAYDHKGETVIGVIIDPFDPYDEMAAYVAEKGSGAWRYSCNIYENQDFFGAGKRIHVSTRTEPKKRFVDIGDGSLIGENLDRKPGFWQDVSKYAQLLKATGSNIRSSMYIANGNVDIHLCDAVGGPWDHWPSRVLVPEAGGIVCGLDGKLPAFDAQVVLETSGVDHEKILEIANRWYKGYKGR